MKKIILLVCLFLSAATCFTQQVKKNGVIYINHPYIEAVNAGMDAYLKKDNAAIMKIYSDTCKYWVSGLDKPVSIKEAIKMWNSDFDYYDSVIVKPNGYPDYLSYIKDDSQIVQSWWIWNGRSKKTGEKLEIYFVQFDWFNKGGKITFEAIYGDFSKMVKE
ncbi:MAG: hypothetical protein V4556_13900 [Bacteroidota bacterium]